LANACQCYGLYDNDEIIGFMGVLHQPHGINKKIKRVSRLVILPDYQGIGLGTKFLEKVAEHYVKYNYDFSIKTSAKNLIKSLIKNNKWCFASYGKSGCSSQSSAIDYKRKSLRTECKTASFFYKK
jgi:GNAT superfamily N-acetyltransferase